ncbi:MAG: type I 3-dehydroquinate dehydratase [archaeon]
MVEECRLAMSISENTLDGMLHVGKELEKKYAPIILEPRLDCVPELVKSNHDTSSRLKKLLTGFEKTPLIITNTSIAESGPNPLYGYKGNEKQRRDLLQYAANVLSSLDRINYVSVELDRFEELNRNSKRVKVIVMKHFFKNESERDWIFEDLEDAVVSMRTETQMKRADIGKIAVFTDSPEKVEYVNTLIERYAHKFPLIALPMGPYDFVKDARNENMKKGIYLTFVASENGAPSAPGQPSIIEARNFLSSAQ